MYNKNCMFVISKLMKESAKCLFVRRVHSENNNHTKVLKYLI